MKNICCADFPVHSVRWYKLSQCLQASRLSDCLGFITASWLRPVTHPSVKKMLTGQKEFDSHKFLVWVMKINPTSDFTLVIFRLLWLNSILFCFILLIYTYTQTCVSVVSYTHKDTHIFTHGGGVFCNFQAEVKLSELSRFSCSLYTHTKSLLSV